MPSSSQQRDFDAIVIGSGISGGWAAKELTELGLRTLVLEAGTGITLKVGGNFVSITPAGVDIVGTMVKINSGGAALSGQAPSPTTATDASCPALSVPTVADAVEVTSLTS